MNSSKRFAGIDEAFTLQLDMAWMKAYAEFQRAQLELIKGQLEAMRVMQANFKYE